jgi:hypothetical protein
MKRSSEASEMLRSWTSNVHTRVLEIDGHKRAFVDQDVPAGEVAMDEVRNCGHWAHNASITLLARSSASTSMEPCDA